LFWEIGGWQNQDSMVSSRVNGRNSCLTHSLLTVDTDREYRLSLEVSGRHICTFVDGTLINDTQDMLPVIEPLYYTASREASSGDVILKAVNLQDEPVDVVVSLDGIVHKKFSGTVFEMSGFESDAQNSFETPRAVVPVQRDFSADGNIFRYRFPKQSVTILRLRERE
jgi:alpha-L-arabinofuranosidase